jgi:hypothetical protein
MQEECTQVWARQAWAALALLVAAWAVRGVEGA